MNTKQTKMHETLDLTLGLFYLVAVEQVFAFQSKFLEIPLEELCSGGLGSLHEGQEKARNDRCHCQRVFVSWECGVATPGKAR